MKKSIIGVLCAAVFAAGLLVSLGLQGAPAPDAAIGSETPAAPASSASVPEADAEPSAEQPDGSGASRVAKSESGRDYEQGVMLVGLQDGVTAEQLNARLAGLDYIATKQVSDDDITLGYVKLNLAEGVDVKEAESRFAGENADLAKSAQPNYIYRLLDNKAPQSLISGIISQATRINDPKKSQQWALDAVNAYEAWDVQKTDGAVTVAVLDNGFLTTHEDLKDNIVETYNAVDGGDDVSPKFAVHGTHVAGIIAAKANNGKGIAGVSYNAGLLPIQVFSEDGAGDDALLRAYDYIINHAQESNIRVANMSLGGAVPSWTPEDVRADTDDALAEAVGKASEQGVLTVCASGNDADVYDAYVNNPSDWLPNSLGVIALKEVPGGLPKRDVYSNFNMPNQTTKNISAPGSGILSSVDESTSAYAELNGTSMASPCVAGIAALVFAANPALTPEQVKNIICNTAYDLGPVGWDRGTGFGLIDAKAAVQAAHDRDAESVLPNLAGVDVELSTTRYTYNGTEREPAVHAWKDGRELKKGEDYTLEYSNNVNAGTAEVTLTAVEGSGFVGSATKTFTIAKAVPKISLSFSSRIYNGKPQTPRVTVQGPQFGYPDMQLSSGTDYEVTYAKGRKSVGKYAVKVTMLNHNFAKPKLFYFTILPKATMVSKLTPAKNGFKVAWKRQATKMPKLPVTGYQVQFSLNSKFASGNKTATIKGYKNTAKSVGKLKAKKRYYVRVRTFSTVGGKNFYSPWSPKKSVVTKA